MSLFFCLSTHVDMPHRQDLALVVTGLDRQADGQRDRAHAAHEHDQHVQQLGPDIQLAGNAHRQANRAECRAGLKDGVDDGHGIRGVVVDHHRRASDATMPSMMMVSAR